MTTVLARIAAAVACLAMLGCATMSNMNVQRPTAALTGMNLGGVTPDGFTMNFLVNVTNPNGVQLPVQAADYELGLAGVKVVADKTKLDKGLPANATTSLTMPVLVKFDDLLKAEREIVKTGGDVPFSLTGTMNFGAGSWLPGQSIKVPLQYTGTVPLKRLLNDPQAIMQSPAARKLAQDFLTGWLGR